MPIQKGARRRNPNRKRRAALRYTKRAPSKKVATIRKSKRRNQSMVAKLGRTLTPFPPVFWTALTYSKAMPARAQTTPGVPYFESFRANSLFDPEVSIGGKQPRYYDSLCGPFDGTAPYRFYRVHASKIEATVWPTQSSVGSGNLTVALIPRRSTVAIASSVEEMWERPYTKYTTQTQTQSTGPRRVSNMVKMKYILGHKDLQDASGSAARYDANPNEEVHWDVLICGIDGSTLAGATIMVKITYFCQFYTLTDVADS